MDQIGVAPFSSGKSAAPTHTHTRTLAYRCASTLTVFVSLCVVLQCESAHCSERLHVVEPSSHSVAPFSSGKSAAPKVVFDQCFENYWMTDPVSRASKNMAR